STVKARAIVEPWVISLGALAFFFVLPADGLALAYLLSVFAAAVYAFVPLLRSYGLPRGWRPNPARIFRLVWLSLPLAAADAVEMATRKIDLLILGMFTSPTAVGVYWAA